jgi:hypothetical protein
MQCGRSRDHFLSKKIHRSQINRLLAHPQEEEYLQVDPWGYADDDYWWDKYYKDFEVATNEDDWEQYAEEAVTYDEDYEYDYEYYDDEYYDDEYYETHETQSPTNSINLTRPAADWDF